MKPLHRVALTTAILAAATSGVAIGTTQAAAQSCGFEFTWTRPTVLPPQVVARGVAQCTVPPEEHIAVLKLEYRPANSSRWEVASAAPADHTIPARDARYETSAPCYAGSWRAAVEIWGSIQGNPFTFSDRSGSVDIPSTKCAPRG